MVTRRGTANSMWVMILGSVAVLAALLGLLFMPTEGETRPGSAKGNGAANGNGATGNGHDSGELRFFCAAGIQPPVEAAAQAFERETGIKLDIQWGGSGTLLNNLRVAEKGDLYLAADTTYIDLARDEYDLLAESIPLARQRPVIAARKGNPKNIQSVEDLLRDDVQFAIANPDAASVGKTVKKVLEKTGQWQAVDEAAKVQKPTVNDVAADVAIGSVDAGIIWDATAPQYKELEVVHTPEFDAAVKHVTIGVLKTSANPTAALKFARYLQAPERGQKHFQRHGFETVENGDAWAETPELVLYSGGVNRMAIQQTLEEFEQREGVRIKVVYNGCGILVAQMKSGGQPDAYFACDTSYMVQVRDQFGQPLNVSQTDMIVIVQKGNPRQIEKLDDLARPGLRLGIANEEQSALGALTRRLLEKLPAENAENLYEAIQDNISVRTPTADLLVNELIPGALDAAIVYRANISQVKDKLEAISITEGDPLAVQPIAVNRHTKYPHLTQRLVDAIMSELSRQRFEQVGFQWRSLSAIGN